MITKLKRIPISKIAVVYQGRQYKLTSVEFRQLQVDVAKKLIDYNAIVIKHNNRVIYMKENGNLSDTLSDNGIVNPLNEETKLQFELMVLNRS